jgi:L-fuconolactonase
MSGDGLTFVDAHVHFWDNARMPYPWLTAVPRIADAHTPVELAIDVGAQRSTEMVFVESAVDPTRALDEVRWVEELAAKNPRVAISAIVAQVAVDRGAETEAYDRLRGIWMISQEALSPAAALRF